MNEFDEVALTRATAFWSRKPNGMPIGQIGAKFMSKKTNFPSEKELKEMRELLSKEDASRLLPKNASPTDKVKFLICEKILDYKLSNKLTQRALSEKFGENESLVSIDLKVA
jgi:hypothetical protein